MKKETLDEIIALTSKNLKLFKSELGLLFVLNLKDRYLQCNNKSGIQYITFQTGDLYFLNIALKTQSA